MISPLRAPARRLAIATMRWEHVGRLVGAVTRCLEACARLDAYEANLPHVVAVNSTRIDAMLLRTSARLDRELDRLTAERLYADHPKQQRQAAARQQALDVAEARTITTRWETCYRRTA